MCLYCSFHNTQENAIQNCVIGTIGDWYTPIMATWSRWSKFLPGLELDHCLPDLWPFFKLVCFLLCGGWALFGRLKFPWCLDVTIVPGILWQTKEVSSKGEWRELKGALGKDMPELMQYRNYVKSPSNLDPRYSITLRIKALVEFQDVWVEYQDPRNLGRNTSKWETEEFLCD